MFQRKIWILCQVCLNIFYIPGIEKIMAMFAVMMCFNPNETKETSQSNGTANLSPKVARGEQNASNIYIYIKNSRKYQTLKQAPCPMVWLLMLAFQTPNVFMKWPHKGTLLKPSSSLTAMVEFQRHKNHTRLIWSLGRDGWNDLGSVSEKNPSKKGFLWGLWTNVLVPRI